MEQKIKKYSSLELAYQDRDNIIESDIIYIKYGRLPHNVFYYGKERIIQEYLACKEMEKLQDNMWYGKAN